MSTPEPTLEEATATVLEILGEEQLSAYLRTRKAKRCKQCGFHEPTQGHDEDCPRRKVRRLKLLFEDTDVCAACGEHFCDPGFTKRCRPRHYTGGRSQPMTSDQEVLGSCSDELKGMTRDEIDAWHLIFVEAKEDYEEMDEICSKHDVDYRNRLINGLIHLALRIAEHHHDDLGWLDEELFLEVAAFRRLGEEKNGHD
jgi:hypothetical protein